MIAPALLLALSLALPVEPEPVRPEPVLFIVHLEQPGVLVPYAFADTGRGIPGCESTWRADAIGAAGEIGLWQIFYEQHEALIRGMGYTKADLFDPTINTLVAEAIWRSRGESFQDWSCRESK